MGLLELRSSNWGRVCSGNATEEATPDNDPNYFMVRRPLMQGTGRGGGGSSS